MRKTHRLFNLGLTLGMAAAATGCGDDEPEIMEPTPPKPLEFSQPNLNLEEERFGFVILTNTSSSIEGPIVLQASAVTRTGGSELSDASVQVLPSEVSSLQPGEILTVSFLVTVPEGSPAGEYTVQVDAVLDGVVEATLGISFTVLEKPPLGIAASLTISQGAATVRQGDVETYGATALDGNGDTITAADLTWSLTPAGNGLITEAGKFVGYTPGNAMIVATAASVADTLDVVIEARNGPSGGFNLVGHGEVTDRFTSDLWVHGDFVYTGTWGFRDGTIGNRMLVWDVRNPSSPQLRTTVTVDAATVNDVKVRADGQIAVITRENLQPNGITLLSLADPANPTVITDFTMSLENGVHNVWIEGDFVYAAVDGTGLGLRIVDISNPASPSIAAANFLGSSFLHDVYVRNGLAFLSQWNDGLVILDVGAGLVGGSPRTPIEVGRVVTAFGNVHNAWYWPATGYVFVGEENVGRPGNVHIVDARNLTNPKEVATITVPGATPHNFWLDEENGVLYVGWYSNGLRAFDVTGELLGELDRQDREIAFSDYGTGVGGCPGGPTSTCSWAPQLDNGLVYVSDMNTGLWIFQPNF